MDKISEDAGLSTLPERFQEERIHPEVVIAMLESELAQIGVQIICD